MARNHNYSLPLEQPPRSAWHGEEVEAQAEAEESFPFINVDQSLKIGGSGRAVIRTQVMHNFYRKARRSQPYKHDAQEGQSNQGGPGLGLQVKRFRLMPTKLEDTKKQPKQKTPLGIVAQSSSEGTASRRPRTRGGDNQVPSRDAKERAVSIRRPQGEESQGDETLERPTKEKEGNYPNLDRMEKEPHPKSATKQEEAATEIRKQWYVPQLRVLDFVDNGFDPFNSFPAPKSRRMESLIWHYFHHRLSSSWLMIPVRKSYFLAAIQDLAWFYAAFSHYAGIYGLETGEGDSAESLILRTQSIEVINSRLGDPENEATDGTIGATVALITYESANGSAQALETHVEGVKRMISLRGGIETANFSPAVLRLVAWADVMASSTLCRISGIVPMSHEEPAINISTDLDIYDATYSSFFDPFTIIKDIDKVLALAQSLANSLHTYTSNPTSIHSTDHIGYNDRVYLISRSLIYLCLDPQSDLRPLDHVLCLAITTFADSFLRDMGFYARKTIVNVLTLKAALEVAMSYAAALVTDPETTRKMLWALSIGGVASIAKPERSWFVARLAEICTTLGLVRGEDVERVLAEMLWDPRWELEPGLLWSEVLVQLM